MNKLGIFIVILFLSACNVWSNNEAGVQPLETRNALKDNEGSKMEPTTYLEGEITDIADRNPNFLDLNNENEAHNNRGAYQQKLREIVESTQVFDAGMIYINGHRAVVNVTPTRQLSERELEKHANELEKKLVNAVPRFKIDLRVRNNG